MSDGSMTAGDLTNALKRYIHNLRRRRTFRIKAGRDFFAKIFHRC